MLGRWVEITGRLESETSKNPDNLRELDVLSSRMVPVVPPQTAAATPPARQTPPPQVAESRPTPTPAPVATAAPAAPPAEPRTLPKTASQLPAIGLAGLLALAAGLMLRSFRRRQRG
jgi:LPXTG-motif cell wall-anchored protein